MRITRSDPHLPAFRRGPALTVSVNGVPVEAYAGETVAAVLLAQGIRAVRHTARTGDPRGIFCGIGICYECLVTVNGVPDSRACHTRVAPGMTIETQDG